MPKFTKKNEAWVDKQKQLESECTNRVKAIAENYIVNPETIAEAIEFGSKFHNYSLKNMQLIYSQNPHAQYVQSYPAWKKMGYSVKRGETGMKVWVPVPTTLLLVNGEYIKLSEATEQQRMDYQNNKIKGETALRFKLGTVFDIAQTTYPPEKYPELFSVGYPSVMHDDLAKGLIDYAQEYVHYDVKIEDLKSIGLRGYCSMKDKEIVINSTLQGTQKLSTIAHELGHAIRHNIQNDLSPSRKELEADGISIMIESGYGLEITDARKQHLVEHYNTFKAELEKKEGLSNEELQERINDVLASVYGTYSACIDDINSCVERYVPKERLLEYIAQHGIDKEKEIDLQLEENTKNLVQERELEQTQEIYSAQLDMDELELEL